MERALRFAWRGLGAAVFATVMILGATELAWASECTELDVNFCTGRECGYLCDSGSGICKNRCCTCAEEE